MGCRPPSDAVAFELWHRGPWHAGVGREASTPLAVLCCAGGGQHALDMLWIVPAWVAGCTEKDYV